MMSILSSNKWEIALDTPGIGRINSKLKATRNQLELLKQENDKNKKEIENHNKIN